MNKPISFIIALYIVSLALPASAGVLRNLRDDRDNACVIGCLEASQQCSLEDRKRCQQDCHRPTDVQLVVGGAVLEVDVDFDAEYKAILELQARLNLDPKTYEPIVISHDVNPLADLGVNFPISQFVTFIPLGSGLPQFPDGTNAVPVIDKIACTWPKNQPLPIVGGFGAGCRETARNGTAGWAALGCMPSNGCCNRVGADGVLGSGVCTVNSTSPGDGIY
jgi:hypothetical protein